MKKNLLAGLLALLICLACVFPAYGDSKTYIWDDTDRISETQLAELNDTAESLRALTGVRAFFAETDEACDASEYAETVVGSLGIDSSDRAVLLAVTESQWFIQLFGDLRTIYSEAQLDALWDAADEAEQRTGYDLAGAYYAALPQFLDGISASETSDGTSEPDSASPALLVDNADLLSESERSALLERLTELRDEWKIEVSIVTTPGIGEKSLQDYTDDFYDHNGYGYGSAHDGVMLLVNMGQDGSERACHITAVGSAISVFTDARRDRIAENFLPDLKTGNYADAFRTFTDDAAYYISAAHSDHNDGDPTSFRMPFNWRFAISISVIVGLISAWIAVAGMKRKLKSVNRKTGAADYTRPGSMNVTDAREFFLYSHIDRRERPKDDDHGGSTIHTSSSGTEHSGSSYKF